MATTTMRQVLQDTSELYEQVKRASQFSTEDDLELLAEQADDLAEAIREAWENEEWVDCDLDEDGVSDERKL